MMQKILNWVRNNPITLAAGFILLASLLFIGWVWTASGALKKQITDRQQEVRKIETFMSQNVDLPPEELGGDAITVSNVTFNDATIRELDNIFSKLNAEADSISEAALAINRDGHPILLEGVFPALSGSPNAPYEFRSRYRFAMDSLLGPRANAAQLAEELGLDRPLPYLEAGLPPEVAELEARLQRTVADGQRAFNDQLTELQVKQLRGEARMGMLKAIEDRARTLDIYADPKFQLDPNTFNAAYPLTVYDWAFLETPPDPWMMWQGQMAYWIQSDIIRAIAEVNGVESDDPNAPANVLEAPVKRLLKLEVLPGSVGLHGEGGVGTLLDLRQGKSGGFSGFGGGQSGAGLTPTSAPAAPATGSLGAPRQNKAVPPNYHFAPSGRVSSHLADVRHARLSVHVDYNRLPAFINALGRVNFMTVVDLQIGSVDDFDFDALGGPYVYGTGQIVRADMIIETLWLREWLAPMMPDLIRESLGLEADAARS